MAGTVISSGTFLMGLPGVVVREGVDFWVTVERGLRTAGTDCKGEFFLGHCLEEAGTRGPVELERRWGSD